MLITMSGRVVYCRRMVMVIIFTQNILVLNPISSNNNLPQLSSYFYSYEIYNHGRKYSLSISLTFYIGGKIPKPLQELVLLPIVSLISSSAAV